MDPEELSKLKKKYKGDQAKELNPMICDIWLDLRPVQSQGCKSFLGRGSLKQTYLEAKKQDKAAELTEEEKKKKKKADADEDEDPNCNPQPGIEKSYLKLEFETIDGTFLTPKTGEIMPSVSEISLPIVHHLPKVTQSKKFVGEFKKSLKKTIGSLVEDYGRTYQTDLSRADELKKHGIFND